MSATVTLSLSEYEEKQTKINELEARLERMAIDLNDARLGGADGDVGRLAEALSHALPIVQFAVASYTPRMYPGWPHADLEALAKLLPELPGIDPMLQEIGLDLQIFARDAGEWEKARAEGTHIAKFHEENAGVVTLPDELLTGGE